MLKELLMVGCGGFVGTAGRYLVGRWVSDLWSGIFPLGTFLVNIIGCFVIGVCSGLIEETKLLSPQQGLMLTTGFCGGFTTFSAFANEMRILGQQGQWVTFGVYLGLSVVLGILCVWAGRAVIR